MEATPGKWEDLMCFFTLTNPYERMVKKLAQLIVKKHPARDTFEDACNNAGVWLMEQLARAVEKDALPNPPTEEETARICRKGSCQNNIGMFWERAKGH